MKRASNKSIKCMKIAAVLFLACIVALSGCVEKGQNNNNNETANNTTVGQEPGDEEYTYGTATVEKIQIMTLESFPVQIHVLEPIRKVLLL
jgi:inhibitor of cysteine peptidase